ncbi:MAG: phosphatase domain-containing protein [Ferruginibacter sp.]
MDSVIQLDDMVDKQVYRLRQRLGTIDTIQVQPFRTYGTPRHVYVRGRVLEDKKISVARDGDTLFTNLLNMYKRFETDEVPGATLQLNLPGDQQQAITDKEGYFVFNFQPVVPLVTEELYLTIPLQLVQAPGPFSTGIIHAEMMIPPADAEYGIISDIDDTIIRTGATDLLAMGKTVLLGNARTRLPFAGVTEFYRSLQLGRNGKRNNPFFYVSSSPWNLYDLLIDYMDHNNIPQGPLLLRDFGIQSESFMSGDYLSHKFTEIKQILDSYPQLNFVLVGDSGEQDPGIYLEVVKKFPGRIICIYIRDVIGGKKQEIAKGVAIELKALGVEMVLTEHTVKAAEHAAASGLIFTAEIPKIVQDKKEDKGQLPGKVEPEAL